MGKAEREGWWWWVDPLGEPEGVSYVGLTPLLYCHYCRQGMRRGLKRHRGGLPLATIDHVVPLSKGGPERDKRNQVMACSDCNGRKSDQRGTCECLTCTVAWRLFGPRVEREGE